TVNLGDTLTLPNIGQFTDPGFDNPLNIGGETTETFSFVIDWGDGSPVDSGPGTVDTPGNVGILTAGSFDGSHLYTAPGVYTVTVTLSDDDGGTAVAQFTVTVVSRTPILVTAPNQTVNEGSLLGVVDLGKFTDSAANVGGYTYSIDWGDGRPVDFGAATIDS